MHVLIPALHRPTKPTGVCRHAANLAQCLVDLDHVNLVTLIIGKWQEPYFEHSFNLNSPKIELLTIDITNSSVARNRWFVFTLPKIAHQLQPDIIHLSFPFPFVRKWYGVPVVSTIHDLYPFQCPENFGYPQAWFNRWFLKQCIDNSNGLSCVSQVTLDSLNQYFPQAAVNQHRAVIYNYVEFDHSEVNAPQLFLEDKASSSTSDQLESKFILCVAQHRKNKNLDLLIRAYAQLRKERSIDDSIKLVLVGSSGPETQSIHELVEKSALSEQVIFLSALPDQELCWLYKNCTLFVVPSSAEGFCLPLIEALFWGCKVVCSDIPIFREVGSNECLYFDLENNSMTELMEAIVHAIYTIPSGLSTVNSDFIKENIAQKLMKFYSSVDAAAV
ncbi:MAG: glycosyltransferase family 1 protein [Elainellaceae cyanobacterium]